MDLVKIVMNVVLLVGINVININLIRLLLKRLNLKGEGTNKKKGTLL